MTEKCGVCRINDSIGVGASRLGPVSINWCVECIRKPAEPEWHFEYWYNNGLEGRIVDFYTFHEGAYMSWEDYKAYRKARSVLETS